MIAQLSGSAISLSLNQQKLSNFCLFPAASLAASSRVISPMLMLFSIVRSIVCSCPSRWCHFREDRTGIAVVDPRRLQAFAWAAEFHPPLRSRGSGSRCCLIAEAEPPLYRLGRSRPVVPDRDITPGGVRWSGFRSRLGSDLDKLFRWLRRFFGLAREAQDEVSRFAGLCRCCEDEARIAPHRLEPVPNVGDVVFEVFRCRDAQLPAQEARPYLGDEFAQSVGVLLLLAGPVQAGRVLAPMAQFVEASAIEFVQALESGFWRHLDVVPRRAVKRLA